MKLIYEDKVPIAYRTSFIQKVKEVASRLGVDANWLMAIMYWESARSFSASIKNPYSNATGLIQFMPSTARDLGTSIEDLSKMTEVQQLEWVYKYYARYKSKLKSYIDLYLTTFFPLAVGKPDNWTLQTRRLPAELIARQNPAFDINKDGKVTVGEIKAIMIGKLPKNWLKYFQKKKY